MTPEPDRFTAALKKFDAANAADPQQQQDGQGLSWPKELLYASA